MQRAARDAPRNLFFNICLQGRDPSCLYQADNFWAAELGCIHEISEQMQCWRGGMPVSCENRHR